MYYPSFFAGVRPFETLRERVENPLDLSVKQTVSRPEGSCPTEHEDLQLLIERKLVSNGLPSQSMTQQMPLLDNMFQYKPFGTESMSCQMRGSAGLLGQNLSNPFCTSTSSGHPINHLGLTVPEMLHQSTNPLAMEATAPSLTSFGVNATTLPYHMRIGSAAAVMANQRAYFGHSSVLGPHISAPFNASMPHISLYSDLMNDMTRRPVEPEASVFGALSSLRTPSEPTTRFSEHLQRLRGQHLQQNKCSGPCCLPSLHSNPNHSSNGCNCCDVSLPMQSNVSALVLPSPHSSAAVSVPVSVSIPCNDVCNRDLISNNNSNHTLSDKNSSNNNKEIKNSFEDSLLIKINSFKQNNDLKHQSCTDRQSLQKKESECISYVTNHHLWNPSNCNKHIIQPIDCHNNHSDKSGPNSNEPQKESFFLNSRVSDKRETGFLQNNSQEVITLDEKCSESEAQNSREEKAFNSRHMNERSQDSHINDKQMSAFSANTSDNTCPPKMDATTDLSNEFKDTRFDSSDQMVEISANNGHNNHINEDEEKTTKTSILINPTITEKCVDNSNTKQKLKEKEFLLSHKENHENNKSDTLLLASNSEITQNQTHLNEGERTNQQNCGAQVKPNSTPVSVTKLLKDYKPINVGKHINITSLDKNKRQMKETKTVEVQCDGPDWTPIVLPAQLKNKLQKVLRKKLFAKDCKKINSSQLFDHKKEFKKKKKCKQKHSHRNQNRSRSSSMSSNSSRKSSPERESETNVKSKKLSMLKCLINSEGYVADKIKKNDRQLNLFASDPSQLGREERALQRAIKHIEDLNKPYVRDNCLKTNGEVSQITQNNSIDENKGIDSNATENSIKDKQISKKLSESYQRIIESVVCESRLHNQCSESDQTNNNIKKKKKSKDSDDTKKVVKTNERTEPTLKVKTKTKRKLRQRLIEKLLDGDQHEIDERVGFKNKKKKVEQNKKCDNKVIKTDVSVAQNNTKQKKSMVNVRRRRFRSGLDMIRNGQRRKKAKSQIQNQNVKESNSNLSSKINEEISQKSNCEPTNGTVPTEMKRLMVNKALGETLLHRAARSNRLDVVNFCLHSNTCDVNARDNANYTPLHECCTRGNLEIARLLLQNGADVNASAVGGIRPIHDAIENNHIEVVRLLLSYGADPNISTYSGSTAIQLSRSKAMLKFLKDTDQTGFDIFDGLPSDAEEESRDFLFEVSDSPMDPTYRLPNMRFKGSDHFMCLSDVLNKTRLTREEFVKKHSDIEIISIAKHELEMATLGQILTNKSKTILAKSEDLTQDIVFLDDRLRNLIGIDILRLR